MLADVLVASLEKSQQGCAILSITDSASGSQCQILYTNSAWQGNLVDGEPAIGQPPFLPPVLED